MSFAPSDYLLCPREFVQENTFKHRSAPNPIQTLTPVGSPMPKPDNQDFAHFYREDAHVLSSKRIQGYINWGRKKSYQQLLELKKADLLQIYPTYPDMTINQHILDCINGLMNKYSSGRCPDAELLEKDRDILSKGEEMTEEFREAFKRAMLYDLHPMHVDIVQIFKNCYDYESNLMAESYDPSPLPIQFYSNVFNDFDSITRQAYAHIFKVDAGTKIKESMEELQRKFDSCEGVKPRILDIEEARPTAEETAYVIEQLRLEREHPCDDDLKANVNIMIKKSCKGIPLFDDAPEGMVPELEGKAQEEIVKSDRSTRKPEDLQSDDQSEGDNSEDEENNEFNGYRTDSDFPGYYSNYSGNESE